MEEVKLDIIDRPKRNSGSSSSEEKIVLAMPQSPSLQQRRLEHKWAVAEEKYNNTWKSCCMLLDRRAVQYFTQIGIITGVMMFCIYQLTSLEGCDSQQTYMGLLTLLLGILIPNPQFNDKKNNSEI